jgi:hypothetical protein
MEHGERDCEKESVEKGVDWCENLDVLDENGVPKETDNQNVDEHDDQEYNKNLEKVG